MLIEKVSPGVMGRLLVSNGCCASRLCAPARGTLHFQNCGDILHDSAEIIPDAVSWNTIHLDIVGPLACI